MAELGAGTGVCGIAASKLGACHVLLTDLPQYTENISRNCALNACARTLVHQSSFIVHRSPIIVHSLVDHSWGEPVT